MTAVLLQILPVAIAITVNPVPIIAALLMTATRRPVVNGVTYVAVLVVVMGALGAVVLLLFHDVAFTSGDDVAYLIRVAWLLVGLAFVAAFVVLWLRKPARDEAEREPRWMRIVTAMGPGGAAVVGLLLVNYEMQTPAMMDILGGDLSRLEAFVALAVFVVVACSIPVAIIVASIAARRRVAAFMDRAKAWLTVHQRPILLVLFAAIGAIYTTKGIVVLA
jgi:uncharacterized membrane protein YuzA (DUF378 family)